VKAPYPRARYPWRRGRDRRSNAQTIESDKWPLSGQKTSTVHVSAMDSDSSLASSKKAGDGIAAHPGRSRRLQRREIAFRRRAKGRRTQEFPRRSGIMMGDGVYTCRCECGDAQLDGRQDAEDVALGIQTGGRIFESLHF